MLLSGEFPTSPPKKKARKLKQAQLTGALCGLEFLLHLLACLQFRSDVWAWDCQAGTARSCGRPPVKYRSSIGQRKPRTAASSPNLPGRHADPAELCSKGTFFVAVVQLPMQWSAPSLYRCKSMCCLLLPLRCCFLDCLHCYLCSRGRLSQQPAPRQRDIQPTLRLWPGSRNSSSKQPQQPGQHCRAGAADHAAAAAAAAGDAGRSCDCTHCGNGCKPRPCLPHPCQPDISTWATSNSTNSSSSRR